MSKLLEFPSLYGMFSIVIPEAKNIRLFYTSQPQQLSILRVTIQIKHDYQIMFSVQQISSQQEVSI